MELISNECFDCKVNGVVRVRVDVLGSNWSVFWRRKYYLDFDEFSLPAIIINSAKKYLKARLLVSGPDCMTTTKQLMKFLSNNWVADWSDLSDIKLVNLMSLWNAPVASQSRTIRLALKRFYKFCCDKHLAGADVFVVGEIDSWLATADCRYYKDILMWHEERGAMTTSEQELLRIALHSEIGNESIMAHFTRIFLLCCFETIKRPSQILDMKADALIEVKVTANDSQYFLRIPKVKKQLGRRPELWPITESLAAEIIKYSSNDAVAQAQVNYGLLMVRDGTQKYHPMYDTSQIVGGWVKKRNLMSHRTGKLLAVTPYRIRHTGATALAMQGVSSSEIQYILEHDSPSASQTYIDAIGSELAPLLSKVDRKVGYVFTQLNESFFKGGVESYLLDRKILIPVVEAPAVVGSCGLSGRCNKHPFFQCYNGCSYFIAWADADHSKSLKFVNSELERWEKSEGVVERSKAIKDFQRVSSAITDVIKRIENYDA